MRKNKFPAAVPWIFPKLNSWHFPRSPPPIETELQSELKRKSFPKDFQLCWMLNCAGRRNRPAPIWRQSIRSYFVCLSIEKYLDDQFNRVKLKKKADTILITEKVTINYFHLFCSFDGKESAQFMSHFLQIRTWRWHLTDVDDFTRPVYFEF